MRDDAAGFTGSIPEHYEHGLGPMIFVDYAAEMARRVAAAAQGRVLETAAGTGIVTRKLRDFLPSGVRLTVTDLNAPMLEIARTKFAPREEVEFEPADAMALPFADGSFEAVVCQFGLMFFPDKDKSYREVHRVLKPGGRYFFSVWDSHGYNPFGRIADEVARSFFPTDPPQFYRVPFSCHRIDPIKEAVLAAGFADFNASVVSLEKVVPESAAFARGLVYGNPLIDQIRARGGDPERVVEAVLQKLRLEFGADPGRMPLQAIMFSASKPKDLLGARGQRYEEEEDDPAVANIIDEQPFTTSARA
jgi:SAM-dependent methyltransferase